MKSWSGWAALAGLMALAVACGSGRAEPTVAPAAETALPSEAPASGPAAPAVTLQLDDGSTFVSTEAVRPALYVFWAEW